MPIDMDFSAAQIRLHDWSAVHGEIEFIAEMASIL